MQDHVFPMSSHARMRLAERWPDTVLRPQDFDFFHVRSSMPVVGYDLGGFYYQVIGTPIVAVVEDGVVITVYDNETAARRLQRHGYDSQDLYLKGRVA